MINVITVSQTLKKGLSIKYVMNSKGADKGLNEGPNFGNLLKYKPWPFKHLFSTSNFTSTILNCFDLEHGDFKAKQLKSTKVWIL